jgi:hypothetical protein
MRPNVLQLVYALIALTSVYAADQDVLTILRQHDELSTFTSYLEQYPDLVDSLNNGTFTSMYTLGSLQVMADSCQYLRLITMPSALSHRTLD